MNYKLNQVKNGKFMISNIPTLELQKISLMPCRQYWKQP